KEWISTPSDGSQTCTVPSLLPATNSLPSGEKASEATPPPAVFKSRSGTPFATSHTTSVPSVQPVARVRLSGEKTPEITVSVWATLNSRLVLVVKSKSRRVLELLPDAIHC